MSPLPLLACVDVDYRGAGAVAAAILFLDWSSPFALEEHRVTVDEVAPYRPGAFYERELPCILAVLRRGRGPIGVVVVDGYVWLGPQRPGLGAHLHAALGGEIAVIGVAKSPFPGAPATPLLRGDSQRPLYVSSVGVDLASAAASIAA